MKSIIFHSASVVAILFWLITEYHTYDPISLKGPDFLKFYLILLITFYFSIFILKLFRVNTSESTFFFTVLILVLGIIKLIRGLMLGKPIGYLIIILIVEIIGILFLTSIKLNHKIK